MAQEPQKEFHASPPIDAVSERQEIPAAPLEAPVLASQEIAQEQLGTPETAVEEKEGFIEETADSLRHMLRMQKKPKKVRIPHVRDRVTVNVEKIMEEGLEDAYKTMTPVQQQEFKLKGEETAQQIRMLLKRAHVKVKKILRLLLEWLKLIPGVNKFFLMQEAKIKADRIIALKQFDDT